MARICYIQEDEDNNDDDDDDDDDDEDDDDEDDDDYIDDVDRFVLDNHAYNWRFIVLETVYGSTC